MATAANTVGNEVRFSSTDLPVKATGMQAMAEKMWIPFIGMGFMIVVVAFVVGLINSGIATDYFGASKAVREAAERGSELATQKAFIESTKVWLPTVKFLSMGMLLGGVTFLLATILGALRVGGGRVQEALGSEVKIIKPPMTAKVFPMVMMMGMMVLMVAVVIGVVLGTLTYDYWNHSIAAQLNPAKSSLLANLGTINSVILWLEPFKFVGLAMLLAGIGLALATIVQVLRRQSKRLWEILN
jgi:hypothetical protein